MNAGDRNSLSGHGRARELGVTLIEIIAVMAIIVILASIVTGGTIALVKRAQRSNTNSLLDQLANGLDAYKRDHRMYLPSDSQLSSRPLWYALEYEGDYGVGTGDKNKVYIGNFLDLDSGATVADFVYRDGWKSRLRYTCTSPWMSYLIESAGPDGKFGTADDETKEE